MGIYLTLVRRELGSFFASFTGYLIIATVALLLGLGFTMLLEALNDEVSFMPLTDMFYATPYFWIILLLAAPVITIRSFALEKSSGTFETLMTTPVGDLQVVLAKFTGALLFYTLMWTPLLACILLLRHFANDPNALDPGPIASTYVGIFLLGCLFVSLGCFASALTRSQIVAAMLSLTLGVALFLLSFLSWIIPTGPGWAAAVVGHIALTEHMQDFARGVVDTRQLVFYLSLTVFFLFLTLKVVESRRWK